jgi:hypothetical protein
LLEEPWALDVDTTVKPLYGHQEAAKVGYNPQKPGRPSHAYHSYFIANLRLVMEVEVQAGNQTAASFAQPGLWELLDGLPKQSQPQFLRGDCNWGTERAMEGAEQRGMAYLFKLKQSANVKKLIAKLFRHEEWVDAGQTWQELNAELQLSGWSQKRRVVVLRRPLRAAVVEGKKSAKKSAKQLNLDLPEAAHQGVLYEYAVLVTSLKDEVRTIAQHWFPVYRLELAPQALPGPRRFGKQFRRVEESMGLGRLHHARPKALSDHGPYYRTRLQLVDDLHAAGHPG